MPRRSRLRGRKGEGGGTEMPWGSGGEGGIGEGGGTWGSGRQGRRGKGGRMPRGSKGGGGGRRSGDAGPSEKESGSPDLSSRTRSRSLISARNWGSRREMILYLSIRKQLRKKTKFIMEKELKLSLELELESVEDMIEQSARDILKEFLQKISAHERGLVAPSLPEQEDPQQYMDLEVVLFCEEISKQMKKLLGVVPTTTEEGKLQHIRELQLLSYTIDTFCALHGQHLEELQAMGELGAKVEETQAAVALGEPQAMGELGAGVQETLSAVNLEEPQATKGLQTKEKEQMGTVIKAEVVGDQIPTSKEQEGSSKADADGEAKIQAGVGDQIPTETVEAPWFDIYHQGKSVTEMGEEEFAAYRRGWEREWGNGNSFENLSLLSPMIFTHTLGGSCIGAVVGRTFHLVSVKIAKLTGIQWPLKVYGVVAGRDDVDKNRIPLFLRSRDDYQLVHEKDPFLQLTGPCRSIVSEEPVEIEIQLRVHRGKKCEDRPLISDVYYYNPDTANPLRTCSKIENHLCKIELTYQQIKDSVQATLFDFRVGVGSPFHHGIKVFCFSLPQDSKEEVESEDRQIVLFDSGLRKVPMGDLNLSRQVVSVQLQGKLGVHIQAYAPSGDIAAHGSVFIPPRKCHTSQHTFQIGGCEVKFTVAWSLLLADKTLMLMNGYVDPFEDLPPFDPSVLEMLGISE